MSRPIAPARIDWVDRQVTEHRDLRDAREFLDARRARHVRGAHRTVGVALGLAVSTDLSSSPRTVTVAAGLAYDPSGRELLLEGDLTVAIPDEAFGEVVVVITSNGCTPGADVLVEPADGRKPSRWDVPIAVIDLAAGDVDVGQRPHVASMAPPLVAGGHVDIGGAGATGTTFAYTVSVDTGAAGFEQAPIYLVQANFTQGATSFAGLLLGPLLDVHDAGPGHFSLTVRYVAPSVVNAAFAHVLDFPIATNPFPFDWIGYEPQASFGVGSTQPPPLPVV